MHYVYRYTCRCASESIQQQKGVTVWLRDSIVGASLSKPHTGRKAYAATVYNVSFVLYVYIPVQYAAHSHIIQIPKHTRAFLLTKKPKKDCLHDSLWIKVFKGRTY